MNEYKILGKSKIDVKTQMEYPTMNEEGIVQAELIMRIWNDYVSKYDGVSSIVSFFETENGLKFKTYVFAEKVNGENVWKPKSGNIDFHDSSIKDRYSDGKGDIFELTFKMNKKNRTYLDDAIVRKR